MIVAAAGEDFVALVSGITAGLEGTLTVQIDDLAGVNVVAPTTVGVAELEPGSYSATLAAPAAPLGEYAFIWDDQAGNTVTEALVVSSSSLDAVRRKIGDSDPADELLADADIQAALVNWPGNSDLAAAECAEAIAAKFARDYSFQTASGQQFSRRERVEHYMNLAETLRSRGGALIWPSRVTVNP